MKIKHWTAQLVAILALLFPLNYINAQSIVPDFSCPDESMNVLTNVCIDCFFPLRIAGIPVGGGSLPNDVYSPICICPAPTFLCPICVRIGLVSGGWFPEGIFEVTPREYCSPTMGGTILMDDLTNRGVSKYSAGLTYNNAHYLPYPIGLVSDLLTDFACSLPSTSVTDVGMWSELDPTWDNPALAALKTPDGVPLTMGSDLMATMALGCAAEYLAMQANGDFFGTRWCTGGSGQTYPLTGYAIDSGNPALIGALQATRLLDEMYRLGMQGKTWGNKSQVCKGNPEYSVSIPKNGHRMQQVSPGGEDGNHRIGDDWNAGSIGSFTPSIPGFRHQAHGINNTAYIFIDWKYKECCVF